MICIQKMEKIQINRLTNFKYVINECFKLIFTEVLLSFLYKIIFFICFSCIYSSIIISYPKEINIEETVLLNPKGINEAVFGIKINDFVVDVCDGIHHLENGKLACSLNSDQHFIFTRIEIDYENYCVLTSKKIQNHILKYTAFEVLKINHVGLLDLTFYLKYISSFDSAIKCFTIKEIYSLFEWFEVFEIQTDNVEFEDCMNFLALNLLESLSKFSPEFYFHKEKFTEYFYSLIFKFLSSIIYFCFSDQRKFLAYENDELQIHNNNRFGSADLTLLCDQSFFDFLVEINLHKLYFDCILDFLLLLEIHTIYLLQNFFILTDICYKKLISIFTSIKCLKIFMNDSEICSMIDYLVLFEPFGNITELYIQASSEQLKYFSDFFFLFPKLTLYRINFTDAGLDTNFIADNFTNINVPTEIQFRLLTDFVYFLSKSKNYSQFLALKIDINANFDIKYAYKLPNLSVIDSKISYIGIRDDNIEMGEYISFINNLANLKELRIECKLTTFNKFDFSKSFEIYNRLRKLHFVCVYVVNSCKDFFYNFNNLSNLIIESYTLLRRIDFDFLKFKNGFNHSIQEIYLENIAVSENIYQFLKNNDTLKVLSLHNCNLASDFFEILSISSTKYQIRQLSVKKGNFNNLQLNFFDHFPYLTFLSLLQCKFRKLFPGEPINNTKIKIEFMAFSISCEACASSFGSLKRFRNLTTLYMQMYPTSGFFNLEIFFPKYFSPKISILKFERFCINAEILNPLYQIKSLTRIVFLNSFFLNDIKKISELQKFEVII
ncbi:hypothetical protein CWI39_0052p0030 [Hamiltosporidium magnivora]|uniref:Uncharacterized protein n=1 Tax=Hamiltosporidium magnivora TaxID=148818 RepID=A0A4Q9LQ29_9MICR|nr:hypothetical protein CWI39_0052p0030 [Hamiltosporidium magnivora]